MVIRIIYSKHSKHLQLLNMTIVVISPHIRVTSGYICHVGSLRCASFWQHLFKHPLQSCCCVTIRTESYPILTQFTLCSYNLVRYHTRLYRSDAFLYSVHTSFLGGCYSYRLRFCTSSDMTIVQPKIRVDIAHILLSSPLGVLSHSWKIEFGETATKHHYS